LCRTASFDVLSVNIGLTDSPVGELKNQKSVVSFEQEGFLFHLYGSKNPWVDWTQSFLGGNGPRRNHTIQIWWRWFRGFWLAEGQSLLFLIDFEGRPYNTHTIVWGVIWSHLLPTWLVHFFVTLVY